MTRKLSDLLINEPSVTGSDTRFCFKSSSTLVKINRVLKANRLTDLSLSGAGGDVEYIQG